MAIQTRLPSNEGISLYRSAAASIAVSDTDVIWDEVQIGSQALSGGGFDHILGQAAITCTSAGRYMICADLTIGGAMLLSAISAWISVDAEVIDRKNVPLSIDIGQEQEITLLGMVTLTAGQVVKVGAKAEGTSAIVVTGAEYTRIAISRIAG